MVFKLFWFCLTFSVSEKLKNSICEMLIFPKALSVNKMRHVKAKSINLHTRRKLIEYYF